MMQYTCMEEILTVRPQVLHWSGPLWKSLSDNKTEDNRVMGALH